MRTRRLTRGQAATELAASMLVIVPTFMYIMFLDDLLRAKLDMIEAVATAPWEYARVNFQEGAPGTGTRSAVRRGWCDHVSSYNSYDTTYDCSEDVHHVAHSAHQCWMTEGGKQVTCEVKPEQYKLQGTFTADGVHNDLTKGGMVRCSARLGVINYFLPQKLFTEFTNEFVTTTENRKAHTDVHDNYGLAKSAHILLEEQTAGLVVDTWQLHNIGEKIDSTGSGPLKDRVNKVYQTYAGLAAFQGMDFYMNFLSNDLVNMSLLADGMGDNPFDANIAFDPDNGTFNEDMHGSPYDFERQSRYMGEENPPD